MDRTFSEVISLADSSNVKALKMWSLMLYNIFPVGSWRSKEAMQAWHTQGGTKGHTLPYLDRYAP